MIEEKGRIVAIESKPGVVWVETIRQSACESCAARNGCGQSVLAKLGQQHKNHVRALCDRKVAVGDEVVIGIPEDIVLKGSLVAYLMPLVITLVAAVTADTLGAPEPFIGLASLVGLVLGFVAVRFHFHRIKNDPRYQPVVLQRDPDQVSRYCPTETL